MPELSPRGVLRAIKRLVFGEVPLQQSLNIGLVEPQAEVGVWLHGMGAPMDVTERHSTACAAPFAVCIALDESSRADPALDGLALHFCERGERSPLLGKIGLKPHSAIPKAQGELFLFTARSVANYCLPRMSLAAYDLLHRYLDRGKNNSGIRMSPRDVDARNVTFIRPHPVAVMSLMDQAGGNIFPMNIMGNLGPGRLGFALQAARSPSHLVEQTRRVALSSVPLTQSGVVDHISGNHRKDSVEWDRLPFSTRPSSRFGIPVPEFALRVREVEVESLHKMGSHTFFVSRVISDETLAHDPALFVVHGFYEAWRLRAGRGER